MKYNLLLFAMLCMLCVSIPSCKDRTPGEEDRTATACLFLEYLTNDNVGGAKNMLGLDLRTIGKNQELLEFDVKKAAILLKIHGVPSKESFSYDTIPRSYNEPYNINIPIEINHKADSRLISAVIRIAFVKRLGDKKIASYEIDTKYKKSMIPK